jgi:Flp pilus assembly pilin Flp
MSFLRRLDRDQRAATTLEWSLLLAAIGLSAYYTIRLATDTLVGHDQMMTFLNSLPFP